MRPLFIFLGKQTNVIDDATHFVNDVKVVAVFVVNSCRRKLGALFAVFATSQKSFKKYLVYTLTLFIEFSDNLIIIQNNNSEVII